MIKLITDGGLPHPARCCSCGYAGNERFYFWFKYKEKWGQVLICTTCMNEAALLDETGFVAKSTADDILSKNYDLRAENDRLELAAERFTDRFAGLVTEFLHDLSGALPPTEGLEELGQELGQQLGQDSEPIEGNLEQSDVPNLGDAEVSVESIFDASDYVPASREFPDADLESL